MNEPIEDPGISKGYMVRKLIRRREIEGTRWWIREFDLERRLAVTFDNVLYRRKNYQRAFFMNADEDMRALLDDADYEWWTKQKGLSVDRTPADMRELMTPFGPFTFESGGVSLPLRVTDETAEAFTVYRHDDRPCGSPDRVYLVEADISGLSVGEVAAPKCGFLSLEIADCGSDERVDYEVHTSEGFTIGFGYYDDEEYINHTGSHVALLLGWDGNRHIIDELSRVGADVPEENLRGSGYLVVRDPQEQGAKSSIPFRLAWRKGADDLSVDIVAWSACWGAW